MDVVATNRQAHFKYHLLDRYEAGLVLKGSEVKSLRNRNVSISESFAQVRGGEIYLYGMHIGPYEQAGMEAHEPKRPRKLLLNKEEVKKILGKMQQRGFTLVPVSLYFKNGYAKVELALAKGKDLADKRETLRLRVVEREVQRALKR
ncbi:MAG TPA: SsrA-binding protein SmpB [Candidatus Brocadiales bacterium]|nr:SsrA-binding protein SmpB [Candidatus Brocadiales bacterium]